VLEQACESASIVLVHGAIAGWYGQIMTIYPGDQMLEKLYKNKEGRGVEVELGNPSFTPATIASIQVSEALKVIVGHDDLLRHKVLMIDLLANEYNIIPMK